MTDISYVKCLPSFVTRLFVLFVSLLTAMMLAIVSIVPLVPRRTLPVFNDPDPTRVNRFRCS